MGYGLLRTNEKLHSLGEFGLIRQIQQQAGEAEHLVLGIGDDCAIQQQDSGQELLTSTDLLIEGVHFNRQWIGMEDLGRKSVAVNVSDIAAMGGTPKSLFLAVACPAEISVVELEALIAGFLAETAAYGAILAGGDTCRSSGPLMISVTVQGTVAKGKAIRRSGARPGDSIYVSGCLGDSALALEMLQQGRLPDESLLKRHHTPKARVALGQFLSARQLASAMLDVSDGLLADLQHILDASGVGAEIELACLPLSEAFAGELKSAPQLIDLALAGGEDYELLFASSEHNLASTEGIELPLTRIGRICPERELTIRRADRSIYRCARGGFDHFS